MKSLPDGLGLRIRKARQAKQMTQTELACELREWLSVNDMGEGCSGPYPDQVSRWETGQFRPSLDSLVALAVVLDVTTDHLLGVPQLRRK